jgi:monomeric sarcosine oxidase
MSIAIIGAGAMGSAAAWQLAKRGEKVLLFEQFSVGHARGSSHGASRIFRFAYPDKEYAMLAKQCLPIWHDLEADSGRKLLVQTGGLDFAHEENHLNSIFEVRDALLAAGSFAEILVGDALKKQYKNWNFRENTVAVFSPDAGILHADNCVKTMVEQAEKWGAKIYENTPVSKFSWKQDHFELEVNDQIIYCERLILTAGAWLNTLLPKQIPLLVTQEQFAFFESKEKKIFQEKTDPVWIHYGDKTMYGFPDLGNGVKAGWHHSLIKMEVEKYAQVPDNQVVTEISEYMNIFRNDTFSFPKNPTTCLYTSTPDHHFILDFWPNRPELLVASPCSGHGFKFAVGIGKAIADLVCCGKTAMEVGRFQSLTI